MNPRHQTPRGWRFSGQMKRPPATLLPLLLMFLMVGTAGSAHKTATLADNKTARDWQAKQKPADANPQKRDDPNQKIGVFEVRLPVSVKEKNRFIDGLNVNNF